MSFRRILSFVLACLFVFSLGNSATALAEGIRKSQRLNDYIAEITDKPMEALAQSLLISEDTDKREENIKHFIRQDKAIEAVIYPYPVHYQKNGEWTDIDNRLELARDASGKAVYRNKEGSYEVRLAADSSSDQLVTIQKDGYSVSWKLSDVKTSTTASVADASAAQAHGYALAAQPILHHHICRRMRGKQSKLYRGSHRHQ